MLGLGNSICLSTVTDSGYAALHSWDFDGSDDHINLGQDSSIKPTTTNTSAGTGLSISLWVKKDDWNVTTAAGIFSCFQDSGGWGFRIGTRLTFDLRSASGTRTCQSNYKPFESASDVHYRSSGWQHFVATFDGRYVKMYINGALSSGTNTVDIGSDDNAIEYNTTSADKFTDVCIGMDPYRLTGGAGTAAIRDPFPGLINEVAMWDKVLDADAVEEIFEAVNTSGAVLDLTKDSGDYDYSDDLIGLWRGNEGSGTTAEDEGGSNDGTMKNSLAFSSTIPS